MQAHMSFWGELKRRNVFKVGAAYLIAAWLILQVASITFPALNLPEWTITFVTVLLIIGFLIAIILAWAYEVTPDGVKPTKHVPLAESITHVTGRKLNFILAGLLVIAVALLIFDHFYMDRRTTQTEVVSAGAKQSPSTVDIKEAPKTIAVLPFADLSPESDQEYFTDGLSEEIRNNLCEIQDLNVTGMTSSNSFKGKNMKAQEIANELDVEYILEGSVRKAGNAFRITAQLLQGKNGFHLWSKTYDKELKVVADILAVQDDIATAVANELKITLGASKSLKQLGGTDNLKAYEFYLIAMGLYMDLNNEGALESLDSAIALDSGFASAWTLKGLIHIYTASYLPADQISLELEKGLNAAQRAIEIEPNFGEAYEVLGSAYTSVGKFIAAESAFQKAINLKRKQVGTFYSGLRLFLYWSLGYFKKCDEIIEDILRDDPLNPIYRATYILNLGYLGDVEQAEREYKKCKAVFDDPWLYGDLLITWLRFGTKEVLSLNDIPESLNLMSPIFTEARNYIKSPKEGLIELHRIYSSSETQGSSLYRDIAFWAAYFGEPDFALDAMEKSFSLHTFHFNFIWSPAMKEVRKLPRFKEFVRKIGLVDYWNQFGWPVICQPTGDGDFVCD